MTASSPYLECVPNFSEGAELSTISAIVSSIRNVSGIDLLDVSSGAAANRTVVTFAGPPEAVFDAAYEGISVATSLIDLTHHRGVHFRQGATDVCPFVPLRGVSKSECVELARKFARRIADDLKLPVYLYGEAALRAHCRNLARVRRGGFESLAQKLSTERWQPDFGPRSPHPSAGATAIGVRDILIAYNVNLVGKDDRVAKQIAARLRTSDRLPGVRAAGWFIDEFGCPQVTLNLLDYKQTGLFAVFEKVKQLAQEQNVQVNGSEIVGLISEDALLSAGRKIAPSASGEAQLVLAAVDYLGLNTVVPFDPNVRILRF